MSVNNTNGNGNEQLLSRREFVTLLVGAGASVALATLLADPLNPLFQKVLAGGVDRGSIRQPLENRAGGWSST